MADPQIPRIDDPIGQGTANLVANRPSVIGKIDTGRYSHVFAGWRAQEALLVARIADEARSARLPFASGQSLRDLAASEFDTFVPDGPTTAVGSVTLQRTTATLGGVIRRGTKFRRPANPTAQPLPIVEAAYEAVADVPVPSGQNQASVPLQATRPGAYANDPQGDLGTPLNNNLAISDPLFDTGFAPISNLIGGGSDGYKDADIKRIALAFARGRFGPTTSALIAGALRGTGVVHALVLEDFNAALAYVYVADQSWSYSDRLLQIVQQKINDEFGGWGCSVKVLGVGNRFVRVTASVTLRDPANAGDTVGIDDAIRARLQSYFNDRPDFHLFKYAALRGAISSADRRILTCTSVVLTQAVSPYLTLVGDPIQPTILTFGVPHIYLPDNGLTTTYSLPT